MSETLREQYARGLERSGYKRVQGRTDRYWVFESIRPRPENDKHSTFVFLGKAGAVRISNRNAVTSSGVATERRKTELLKAAGAK